MTEEKPKGLVKGMKLALGNRDKTISKWKNSVADKNGPLVANDPRFRVNPQSGRLVLRSGLLWRNLVKRGVADDPELMDYLSGSGKSNMNIGDKGELAFVENPQATLRKNGILKKVAYILPSEGEVSTLIEENKDLVDELDDEEAEDYIRELLCRTVIKNRKEEHVGSKFKKERSAPKC